MLFDGEGDVRVLVIGDYSTENWPGLTISAKLPSLDGLKEVSFSSIWKFHLSRKVWRHWADSLLSFLALPFMSFQTFPLVLVHLSKVSQFCNPGLSRVIKWFLTCWASNGGGGWEKGSKISCSLCFDRTKQIWWLKKSESPEIHSNAKCPVVSEQSKIICLLYHYYYGPINNWW